MGKLTTLLTLPASGPIKAVLWISEQIAEQAEAELYNPEKVRGKLMELELRYDMGEITEEEYLAAEDELLERLNVIRERQRAQQGEV